MNELALFAGAGGGILGGHLLGWRTICAVERDAYAAQVLAQRQNDGMLETFPIWSDVQTFDGKPWRGIVDVISGGFPCQDISVAGKGAGLEGERSGLWSEMARIIGEVRPRYAFIENSPMLTKRGLNRVLCDLAALRYDAKWMCLSADDCEAPHKRERLWLVANSERNDNGRPHGVRRRKREQEKAGEDGHECNGDWPPEPALDRVVDGMAVRMDKTHTSQLRCLGNGQVPRVAATAFRLLTNDT